MNTILNTSDLYLNLLEESENDYELVSNHYYFILEDELEFIQSEIMEFITRFEKRYNTTINSVCGIGYRSSHYGVIGGNGANGGRSVQLYNNNDWLRNLIGVCDDFDIIINDDKNLEINTHDHDGSNTMYIILATEKECDLINSYDNIDYHLFKKGKKPVKLDNEIINNFGGLK